MLLLLCLAGLGAVRWLARQRDFEEAETRRSQAIVAEVTAVKESLEVLRGSLEAAEEALHTLASRLNNSRNQQ